MQFTGNYQYGNTGFNTYFGNVFLSSMVHSQEYLAAVISTWTEEIEFLA
ncbi:MAG: hypothetical protein ACI841_001918 [Planctomycetota bacterium]|jgi:hypothetical protein